MKNPKNMTLEELRVLKKDVESRIIDLERAERIERENRRALSWRPRVDKAYPEFSEEFRERMAYECANYPFSSRAREKLKNREDQIRYSTLETRIAELEAKVNAG